MKPFDQVQAGREVAKPLIKLSGWTGVDYYQIFDEFVDSCIFALDALPDHAQSLRVNGTLAQDTEEAQEHFKRMDARYHKREWWQELMGKSLGILLEQSALGWGDIIGQAYMEMEIGNAHIGQYFTPWPIAKMMAQVMAGSPEDLEKECHKRVKEATLRSDNHLGFATTLASVIIPEENAQDYFFNRIIPSALPYIDPIKVSDPCCGSGIMLLAFASLCPRWAIDAGVVRFYGQDIDRTCVQMCKLNFKLYGLGDPLWVKLFQEMDARERLAIPENIRQGYEMVEADADPEIIQAIRREKINFDPSQYTQGKLL